MTEDIVRDLMAAYPILKDVLGKIKVKKLSTSDLTLILLAQLNNETAKISASLKSLNDEFHRLRRDIRPIIQTSMKLIEILLKKEVQNLIKDEASS